MITVAFILQLIALVFLGLAGLSFTHPKFTYGWIGMFFWLLSLMIGALALHPIH